MALYHVDYIVLKEEFDFYQSTFELTEPSVVYFSNDFSTPHEIKRKMFRDTKSFKGCIY